jgi:hypothetical protein
LSVELSSLFKDDMQMNEVEYVKKIWQKIFLGGYVET